MSGVSKISDGWYFSLPKKIKPPINRKRLEKRREIRSGDLNEAVVDLAHNIQVKSGMPPLPLPKSEPFTSEALSSLELEIFREPGSPKYMEDLRKVVGLLNAAKRELGDTMMLDIREDGTLRVRVMTEI